MIWRKRNLSTCVAGALAVLLVVPVNVQAQGYGYSVSFSYRIDVHIQAHIRRAGVRFRDIRFTPHEGTPAGRFDFQFETTGACNVRLLGRYGPSLRPVFDTGPIYGGLHSGWVDPMNRGDWQELIIEARDCSGNVMAHDRLTFWTPPPQIVTVEQWEQVTISRRTVRVGYR